MNGVLVASLAGLAIVDSTSVGTLFIPVWLLLAPERLRSGRFLGYLATIAGFYFGVGLVLVLGGTRLASALGGVADSRPLLIAQFMVGVVLLGLSFLAESRKGHAAGVILRWRDRAITGAAGTRGLAGLALLAALAEVATMLPYLGAIGMIATAGLAWWAAPPLLAGYCVVMVLPALVLFAARAWGPAWIGKVLERMNAWVITKGSGLLSWVLGIAGFLVARDAVVRLWFPHLIGAA